MIFYFFLSFLLLIYFVFFLGSPRSFNPYTLRLRDAHLSEKFDKNRVCLFFLTKNNLFYRFLSGEILY